MTPNHPVTTNKPSCNSLGVSSPLGPARLYLIKVSSFHTVEKTQLLNSGDRASHEAAVGRGPQCHPLWASVTSLCCVRVQLKTSKGPFRSNHPHCLAQSPSQRSPQGLSSAYTGHSFHIPPQARKHFLLLESRTPIWFAKMRILTLNPKPWPQLLDRPVFVYIN